jgi:hypothetical protein
MAIDNLSLLLSKYFGLSGRVVIPGLGLLNRLHESALNQFVDKNYHPPTYKIVFEDKSSVVPQGQLQYISRLTGTALHEIHGYLEDLGRSVYAALVRDRKIEWIGMGLFQMDDDGIVSFQPRHSSTKYLNDIKYIHVVRKEVEHSIIVGASEKTNHEMEEYFEDLKNRSYWQTWQKLALFIMLISLTIVLIRFAMGNFGLLGPAYQNLHPTFPEATYLTL